MRKGKNFLHWIYSFHFRQFRATLVFVAEKPPHTHIEGIFFSLDLSISGNFQQLWFRWQRSPPPPRMQENFFKLDLSISGNFQQLWVLWQKSPPPPPNEDFHHTRTIFKWVRNIRSVTLAIGDSGYGYKHLTIPKTCVQNFLR